MSIKNRQPHHVGTLSPEMALLGLWYRYPGHGYALADSKNADLAQAFVDLILSPEGQQVMEKYNFIPAAGGSSSSGGVTVTDAFALEVKLAALPVQ